MVVDAHALLLITYRWARPRGPCEEAAKRRGRIGAGRDVGDRREIGGRGKVSGRRRKIKNKE